MAKTVIHLVRHGQYHRLVPDDIQRRTGTEWAVMSDGGLTELGIEQAGLTARRLSEYPVAAIHSSSLPRAAETAAIIAEAFPGIGVQSSEALWECIPYVSPSIAPLLPDMSDDDLARGQRRAEEAYERYLERRRQEDAHEVVVCHGNLIRYFVARALGGGLEAWVRMGTLHCGISQIEKGDDWTLLLCHNDSGHLPEEKRTGS